MLKYTTEEFIEILREVHGDLYDYSKVEYKGSSKFITIICKKHGEFTQQAQYHKRGHGCPKCKGDKQKERLSMNTEEFIRRARLVHGDRYDYSKVVYVRFDKEVIIICPVHGEFLQQPDIHVRQKANCPKCASTLMGYNNRLSLEEVKTRILERFGDILTILDSSTYVRTNKETLHLKCTKCGKKFTTSYNNLRYSTGCPYCLMSNGEVKIMKFLDSNNIENKTQKTFEGCKHIQKLQFDFYLHQYNLCIEYDGKQHYRGNTFGGKNQRDESKYENLLSLQNRDRIKTDYCKDNKIGLLRIPYYEIENIDMILEYYLNL